MPPPGMPALDERTDAVPSLGGLELDSPREAHGVAAPMEEEDPAAEEQRRQHAAHMDRASALIGQRMLQGWAMLDMSCPQCYSPIMRDRQRQLWCVACNMRVVSEGEQTQAEAAGGSGEREAAGQAPAPKRKTSPGVGREAAMEGREGDEEEGGHEAKRQAIDPALTTQQPNRAAARGSDLHRAASGLHSSLVTKLEGFGSAVQECQDLTELSQLLDLIHKLASTFRVVKELQEIDL